jgi:hypothetical protein
MWRFSELCLGSVDAGAVPWKVDCTDDSLTSDVAAVVVPFFGHVDGEERMLGDFGVGGVSAR